MVVIPPYLLRSCHSPLLQIFWVMPLKENQTFCWTSPNLKIDELPHQFVYYVFQWPECRWSLYTDLRAHVWGRRADLSQLSLGLRQGKGHREEAKSFFPPFSRLVQSWVCCLWERVTPALLGLKCLLPRDRQLRASFCFGEAGPGQVVFAGERNFQISQGRIAKWEAPEVQQRLGRQSGTPSFVWHAKHYHVSAGSGRVTPVGCQAARQPAGPCSGDWNGCAFPRDQRHCSNFTKCGCLSECASVALTGCQTAWDRVLFSISQPPLSLSWTCFVCLCFRTKTQRSAMLP